MDLNIILCENVCHLNIELNRNLAHNDEAFTISKRPHFRLSYLCLFPSEKNPIIFLNICFLGQPASGARRKLEKWEGEEKTIKAREGGA
jgi:hypothetical protein